MRRVPCPPATVGFTLSGAEAQASVAQLERENEALRGALDDAVRRLSELEGEKELAPGLRSWSASTASGATSWQSGLTLGLRQGSTPGANGISPGAPAMVEPLVDLEDEEADSMPVVLGNHRLGDGLRSSIKVKNNFIEVSSDDEDQDELPMVNTKSCPVVRLTAGKRGSGKDKSEAHQFLSRHNRMDKAMTDRPVLALDRIDDETADSDLDDDDKEVEDLPLVVPVRTQDSVFESFQVSSCSSPASAPPILVHKATPSSSGTAGGTTAATPLQLQQQLGVPQLQQQAPHPQQQTAQQQQLQQQQQPQQQLQQQPQPGTRMVQLPPPGSAPSPAYVVMAPALVQMQTVMPQQSPVVPTGTISSSPITQQVQFVVPSTWNTALEATAPSTQHNSAGAFAPAELPGPSAVPRVAHPEPAMSVPARRPSVGSSASAEAPGMLPVGSLLPGGHLSVSGRLLAAAPGASAVAGQPQAGQLQAEMLRPKPEPLDAIVPLELRQPQFSRGAELHSTSECRPCAWYWKPQGCANGKDCRHCHMCAEGELKSRRKNKTLVLRGIQTGFGGEDLGP